jgi:hypothetical protein
MSFELVVDTFFSRIEQVKNCFNILVDGSQSLASSDVPEPANARYLQATHPSSSNVLVMTTTPAVRACLSFVSAIGYFLDQWSPADNADSLEKNLFSYR